MRVDSLPCSEYLKRPGVGEFYKDEFCLEERDELLQEEFDGVPYSEKWNSFINTKFGQIPDFGNRKDVLIYDMKLGQPIDNTGKYNTVLDSKGKPKKISTWREALSTQVFRLGGYDELSFLDNEKAVIEEEIEKISNELQGESSPETDEKGDNKTFESIVQFEDEGLRNLQDDSLQEQPSWLDD